MLTQPLSDEGREAVIDILNQLCMNGTTEVRRHFFDLMKQEIARRSQAQVQKIEADKAREVGKAA